MKAKAEQLPLCFVIGPIGAENSHERKHADLLLNLMIRHVLETEEFGYHVRRADEDSDPGMIGDRVVSQIINAELVIADLTDLNPNVFYELGIRHSTLKPAIHIAKLGTLLPFDNAGHRTIFVDLGDWHSLVPARTRLAELTRAISATGFQVSNPITQANASFQMRQSADPREVVIAELQERIGSFEAQLNDLSFSRSTPRTRRGRRASSDILNQLLKRSREMSSDDAESSAKLTALLKLEGYDIDLAKVNTSQEPSTVALTYSDGTRIIYISND
jgi:hypothetical protein